MKGPDGDYGGGEGDGGSGGRRVFLKHLATVGFVGYAPVAPGTFGTLFAALLVALVSPSSPVLIALTAVVIVLGVVSAGEAERAFGVKDPGRVVIDEVAGYMVSVLFLPLTAGYLVAAFFLFRFFDIIKPPPIRKLERGLKGGLGVVADDLMAGLYTNIVLQLWKALN